MKHKKLSCLLIGISMLIPSTHLVATTEIHININGEVINAGVSKPFIDKNNRTLVPLRLISEHLGAQVNWNSKLKQVTLTKNNTIAKLTLNDTNISINNQNVLMDSTAILKDNTVFIPIKYVKDLLDVTVDWNGKQKMITIRDTANYSNIVASVNDLNILTDDVLVELAYELRTIQYQNHYDNTFLQSNEAKNYVKTNIKPTIDRLIKNKVAIIKGNEMNLQPTDSAVDLEFMNSKKNYSSEEAFKQALMYEKLTEDTYKQMIKEQLTLKAVIESIVHTIDVTNNEVLNYYKQNINLLTLPSGATMSHILVDTKEAAEAIRKQYIQGSSFEELAKAYGTDASKYEGGNLGYIPYASTDYDQDFLAAAKTLKENQVSEPIQTQFGWHLIKVTNVHKTSYVPSLEECRESITAHLQEEKSTERIKEKMSEWEKEMKITKNDSLIDKWILSLN